MDRKKFLQNMGSMSGLAFVPGVVQGLEAEVQENYLRVTPDLVSQTLESYMAGEIDFNSDNTVTLDNGLVVRRDLSDDAVTVHADKPIRTDDGIEGKRYMGIGRLVDERLQVYEALELSTPEGVSMDGYFLLTQQAEGTKVSTVMGELRLPDLSVEIDPDYGSLFDAVIDDM